jgi:hypothetical protein
MVMFTVETLEGCLTVYQGNNDFTIFGDLLGTDNRVITVVDTSSFMSFAISRYGIMVPFFGRWLAVMYRII